LKPDAIGQRAGLRKEKEMTTAHQMEKAQPVRVVEADILDRMNETRALIAQRAYEIYHSRGRRHGFDQDDWFSAEQEILPPLDVRYRVTENAARLTAKVLAFEAKDLEVIVAHRRAVICGVHFNSKDTAGDGRKQRRIIRIIELPFDVDPDSASATLRNGTLEIVLPRL
jgi:HSP20 family molecular chaperone IbpA